MDYKEILKNIVNIINTTENSDIGFANICNYIGENCPELKESEGEQNRKWILEYLYDGLRKSDEQFKDEFKAAIAWLEKQSDTDEIINRDEFAQGILKGAAINLITWIDYNAAEGNMCLSNTECKDIGDALVNGDWDKIYAYIKKKLEKHGEQTHAELGQLEVTKTSDQELEPKFHEGDWITSNNGTYTYQVREVKRGVYVLWDSLSDRIFIIGIEEAERSGRLCTIEDARDGDILAINWHEGDDSWEKIIVFKKYHNKGVKGLTDAPCVEGYGTTFKNGKLAFNNVEVPYYSKTWTANLHPATKEQRDLLFQTMKEANYEWDSDKKEWKKIWNEIEIPFGAKDSELQEATYYIPKGFHAEIDDDKVVIKKDEESTARR